MLIRGGGSSTIRHLVDTRNMQENNNEQAQQSNLNSKVVEELIETGLEHFAHEDATLLAEAYHTRVGTERSLIILAHCLTKARSFENAYHLLKTVGNPSAGATGLKTAKCRYLFAYCAFTLNRLHEAENTLKDTAMADQVQLHPAFQGTSSLPYAHSLLAKILCETNRLESARAHWALAIRFNPMQWSALRSYCDISGEPVRELLQPSLDELAQWRENVKGASKAKARETIKMEEGDEQMAPVPRTPSRTRVSHSRGSANTDSTTLTTPSSNATSARKTRLRNTANNRYNPTAVPNISSVGSALRASENSPLTRSNKLGVGAMLKLGPMLIEQQKQQDDKEEQHLAILEAAMSTNKRTTRRATAMAAEKAKAEAASKDAEMEAQKLQKQQVQQDRHIYCELLDWLVQLAEVQDRLSRFRCAEALQLLNALDPSLCQLPLSLELRARIFFENGEYRRSCEVFDEIRRLYPRRVQGMEIFSTALWQLRDPKRLSALTAEMAEVARDQPETWCIAGNCFSLEKQHETAIECLERAIRLDYRFGYAYSLLGHELIDMNDLARAEQAFRRAIVHSPNDYRAWYGLGLVHYKEEKLPLARVNMQHAVQINPSNTVLLCQLAVIEQALHCTDSAMQLLERALKQQPQNVPCRFHKARLLFDTGHFERARVELEELKVLSPDEAHVFFLLGRVNRKLGNTHEALLNFSLATEIDPRGEQNQSALTIDKGPYDDEPID